MSDVNKEIGNDIFIIFNIISDTHYSIENLNFLFNKLTTLERERLDEIYPIIHRIEYLFSINIVLNLWKLLKEDESYSLFKLLNRMINSYKNIKWNYNKIEISKLREYQEKIKSINTEDIFDKIKVFRDKYYAHLDKNRKNIKLSIKETEGLFLIVKEIFGDIYSSYRHKLTWKFDQVDISNNIFKDLLKFNRIKKIASS